MTGRLLTPPVDVATGRPPAMATNPLKFRENSHPPLLPSPSHPRPPAQRIFQEFHGESENLKATLKHPSSGSQSGGGTFRSDAVIGHLGQAPPLPSTINKINHSRFP